jgi:hypothetical protein
MRRVVPILIALTGLTALATANPISCPTDTYDNYVLNFSSAASGCTIADKLFWGFTYGGSSRNGASIVSASNINITPDATDLNNPGLVFTSSFWTVTGNVNGRLTLTDSTIHFVVQTVTGLPLIEDGTLKLGTFVQPAGTDVSVLETINLGGGNSVTLSVDGNNPLIDHKTWSPVSQVTVTKDLLVAVQGSGLIASVGGFSEYFSEQTAPEPGLMAMIGSGLLLIGCIRCRARKS